MKTTADFYTRGTVPRMLMTKRHTQTMSTSLRLSQKIKFRPIFRQELKTPSRTQWSTKNSCRAWMTTLSPKTRRSTVEKPLRRGSKGLTTSQTTRSVRTSISLLQKKVGQRGPQNHTILSHNHCRMKASSPDSPLRSLRTVRRSTQCLKVVHTYFLKWVHQIAIFAK